MGSAVLRGLPWSFALSASILLCAARPASADTVVLRTNEVFSGRILRATPEEVSIQLDSGGILSFRANRIESIRRLSRNGDGPIETFYNKGPEAQGGGSSVVSGESGTSGRKEEPHPELTAPASQPGGKADSGPKELSSFPLHAKKAPAAAAPVMTLEPRDVSRIRDGAKGYSIVPPPGFKPWSDPKLPGMLRGFMDPATQATLVVSGYDSDESLDEIKEGIVRLLPRHSNAKVVREARKNVPGPCGFSGWVLSMENTISETTVNQLQLLAKEGSRIFIITYSASARNYPSFVKVFEESLNSFRIERSPEILLQTVPGTSQTNRSSTADPAGPPKTGIPPEIERHLKGQAQATGPGTTQEPLFPDFDTDKIKQQSDSIIERTDQKLRIFKPNQAH